MCTAPLLTLVSCHGAACAHVANAQVRMQRPTVSAEMSLMLAIAKFFIAGFTLGGVTPTAFHSNDLLLTGARPRLASARHAPWAASRADP